MYLIDLISDLFCSFQLQRYKRITTLFDFFRMNLENFHIFALNKHLFNTLKADYE